MSFMCKKLATLESHAHMTSTTDTAVVRCAAKFIDLMSELTPPEAFYFRTFASDGVDGLAGVCHAASSFASSSDDALASLVIAPGNDSSFYINGAHARATLSTKPTPNTRLIVLSVLSVIMVVILIFLQRR